MESFDTITMSYLATAPMAMPSTMTPMLPVDNLDHHSNFDAETFAGSEDASQYGHAPMMRHIMGYDDGFSDHLSNYDQPLSQEPPPPENTSSIERDNKLLSFSTPSLPYTMLDYNFNPSSINLAAQLHGMFFLAESPWATSGESPVPATELTCYRRNLFQITGELTMPRSLRYILTEQGENVPIMSQELTISATESTEGNPVKIISVPWKSPATSAPTTEDKTEKEPGSIPLDILGGSELDSDLVTVPVAWKRLQFRIATANNGRRRELQQHFVVHLKVMATLTSGARVPLCEVHSGAIVVRGRSPRNFQSRKDMPISGSAAPGRKNHHLTRTSTGDSSHTPPVKPDRSIPNPIEIPRLPFGFDAPDLHVSPDFFQWKLSPDQGPLSAVFPPEISIQLPPHTNVYPHSSPDMTRYTQPSRSLTKAPINLSLLEDEPRSGLTPTSGNGMGLKHASESPRSTSARKAPRLSDVPSRPPSFSIKHMSTSDESADLLYEYFPLGLDDWMPPVDAVYRPHVVHHTNLPADPKALATRNRSKRYFSEDQP